MVQYDVQTVAHIDIPSPNLSAKYWTTSEYQTAEGHSIAEISTEGDTLQTDGNVNLQTCDMTEKIPSSTVARSRINVERSIVTLDDNIGKYADTSEIEVITQDTLTNNGDTIATIEAAANNCNMGTVKFSNQGNQGLGPTKNDAGSNAIEARNDDAYGSNGSMMQATGMVLDDAGYNALEARYE